ncbi:hypothetical protein NEOLEDRAFT_988017 [Neolentinus lepideus HHB14362 ss-1]|uniref:Uncharacterized protein n=1 Tax=Neolentinus lepideus HHB14362 ss-1 TaxID=1314782 RepID=A0A165N630_9AGAM|nr:hypothetical protein NEOLEDRAFT_988017 [Neolentinus lepideus HHB14362 ss-1]
MRISGTPVCSIFVALHLEYLSTPLKADLWPPPLYFCLSPTCSSLVYFCTMSYIVSWVLWYSLVHGHPTESASPFGRSICYTDSHTFSCVDLPDDCGSRALQDTMKGLAFLAGTHVICELISIWAPLQTRSGA